MRNSGSALAVEAPGDVAAALFGDAEKARYVPLTSRQRFTALGVDEKWVYNSVKQVGNYGESFERSVGKDSVLKIDRGPNKLRTQGGLQYAPPIR